MSQKRIIDKRIKEKFMIDDDYLNGMAKLCGWQGTIVYNSLCRHSNLQQESFPSIKLMMEQHNVGRNTILKGISNLEKRRVIEIKRTRTKTGKWLNNIYILLDKSEWNYSQVPVGDMVSQVPVGTQPSPCGDKTQVPVEDLKETHIEGNTYKELPAVADSTLLKEKKTNQLWEVMEWAEKERGARFVNRPKQLKYLKQLKEAKVSITAIKNRWYEMLDDKFWSVNGFDFKNLADNFDKKI